MTASSRSLAFKRLASLFGIALLAAPGLAFAEGGEHGNVPEIFYQPGPGVVGLDVKATTSMPGSSFSLSQNGTKLGDFKETSTGFDFGVGYGINDQFAVVVETGFENEQEDETPVGGATETSKSSGLGDLLVGLSGMSPMSGMTLHYGLGLSLNTSKSMDADAATEHNGNASSGGMQIIPAVGVSFVTGAGSFAGGRLKYTNKMERTVNSNDAAPEDYKVTGGNEIELTGFYEMGFDGISADVALSYAMFDAETTKKTSGNSTINAYNATALSLGVQSQLTAAVNLRVQYDYAMAPSISASGGVSTSAFNTGKLGARARIDF